MIDVAWKEDDERLVKKDISTNKPGGGGDGQEVPELVDLMVDVISPHLARTLSYGLMYL